MTEQRRLNRRRLMGALGLTAGTVVAGQTLSPPLAHAETYRLHDDTNQVGQGLMYTGGLNPGGCDTANSTSCRGPNRMSAYWGALYVHAAGSHQLRSGNYGSCRGTRPAGIPDRMRWASHGSWAPEYRFTGKIYLVDVAGREDPWSGLVLHPVHVDNCNNYFIRIWERDFNKVTFGREVDDDEATITTAPFSAAQRTWHEYRVDVLAGSRVRFWWNGALVFDAVDPARAYSGGPVGMRLDHFDVLLDETRVYVP
jgi:hypothetical protein